MKTAHLFLGLSSFALISSAAFAQTNTSQYSQVGTNNEANVDNTAVGNIGNSSTIIQNGNFNSATVYQRQYFNLSFIQQAGNSNEAVHQQSGTSNSADSRQGGDRLKSAIAQVGNSNRSALIQAGANNISTIRQGYAVTDAAPAGEFRATSLNSATVDQNGYGLASEIGQRGADATAPSADRNTAYVLQRNQLATTSIQQTSRLIQESRGDYAEVFQYDGSSAAVNSSAITQRGTTATIDGSDTGNRASVAQRGYGQSSTVTQDGSRNSVTLRMEGGGLTASEANALTLSQSGADLRASYSLRPLVSARAAGVKAVITQTGSAHGADVYQFGIGDSATVSQSDGVNVTTYAATGERPHADAFISQNATADVTSLKQAGDNFADITQAFGSNSVTDVAQTDAGDASGSRSRNSAVISQYGSDNSISVQQDAISAEATAWQKVGSSNNSLTLGQGVGGTALASTTAVPGFTAGAGGAGSMNLTAALVQAGSGNQATVYQDGVGIGAIVTQLGTATAQQPNLVFVSQTGSSNSATAYQASGVGPSADGDLQSGNSSSDNGGAPADEFFFAGGARSAEINILQSQSGNKAGVYQYGRGQLARIEQSGNNNVAGIVQELTATNATAIIRQSGDSNSYYIDQVAAGQYVSVTQTGNNNIAGNVQRGSAGGSTGFTPPPGYPGP